MLAAQWKGLQVGHTHSGPIGAAQVEDISLEDCLACEEVQRKSLEEGVDKILEVVDMFDEDCSFVSLLSDHLLARGVGAHPGWVEDHSLSTLDDLDFHILDDGRILHRMTVFACPAVGSS